MLRSCLPTTAFVFHKNGKNKRRFLTVSISSAVIFLSFRNRNKTFQSGKLLEVCLYLCKLGCVDPAVVL